MARDPPDPKSAVPKVDIIIPTYFREESLEQAIESSLAQTYECIDIIVVDDSGEEYAKTICEKYPVNYVPKSENEGQIAAWNTGFEQADGDYIQFLDDDDQILPKKIERQVNLLLENNDSSVVHCGIQWDFGVVDYPIRDLRGDVLKQVLTLDTSPCITSTLLIDSTVLAKIMPLKSYQASTDDVLKIELSRKAKFDYIDDVLVRRGTGGENVSTSMRPVEANKQIISDYSFLYDRFDDRIEARARSKTLYREGLAHLENHNWSLDAIIALGHSLYVDPSRGIRPLIIFPLSLGGKPMISAFERFSSRVKSSLQLLLPWRYEIEE